MSIFLLKRLLQQAYLISGGTLLIKDDVRGIVVDLLGFFKYILQFKKMGV
jgi:hypothetical protein